MSVLDLNFIAMSFAVMALMPRFLFYRDMVVINWSTDTVELIINPDWFTANNKCGSQYYLINYV